MRSCVSFCAHRRTETHTGQPANDAPLLSVTHRLACRQIYRPSAMRNGCSCAHRRTETHTGQPANDAPLLSVTHRLACRQIYRPSAMRNGCSCAHRRVRDPHGSAGKRCAAIVCHSPFSLPANTPTSQRRATVTLAGTALPPSR